MKGIKNIFFLTITAIVLGFLYCAEEGPQQSTQPIFSGVEKINLTGPSTTADRSDGTNFLFEAPESVHYFVLGVMSAAPDVMGKTIINDNQWLAGSRSGLAGFSNGLVNVNNLRTYDQGTNNYTPTAFTGIASYYWFVIGFDEWGNLTHASPAWTVDIND